MQHILGAADLGVVGLDLLELEDPFAGMPEVDAEFRPLIEGIRSTVRTMLARAEEITQRRISVHVPALIHKGSAEPGVALPGDKESDGTLAFFGLLGPVLHAIGSGGTVCVDELDGSLHPLLALKVVSSFHHLKLNPHSAQIIFATHDTNLLDKASLRRDQIWFTEKDDEGATDLYPLTDFKPRKNENLERGYLQGRYGAVPFIGSTEFLADIHEEKAER